MHGFYSASRASWHVCYVYHYITFWLQKYLLVSVQVFVVQGCVRTPKVQQICVHTWFTSVYSFSSLMQGPQIAAALNCRGFNVAQYCEQDQ